MYLSKSSGKAVHTFIVITAIILSIASYLYNQKNAPAKATVRSEVPAVTLPSGTLGLITEPEQGTAPVMAMIQGAQKSIDLVMYEFKDKDIADALIAAEKRGVAVRVLVDHGYYGAPDGMNDNLYAYLQNASVPIEWTPSSFALTHQKTMVVDNATALIMTFNFTPEYYATSRDFGVTDTDPTDVKAIEDTFANDWNNVSAPNENGTDLVWSPGSENEMLLTINSAKTSLDVYNEEMADTPVIDALKAAVARGVTVRVVMTYSTTYKPAFAELEAAGVDVKTFGSGKTTLYIHAKMILADDSEAFLGSENFSTSSLDSNRELGLFITDPAILASLKNTFDTDYANARVFTLK